MGLSRHSAAFLGALFAVATVHGCGAAPARPSTPVAAESAAAVEASPGALYVIADANKRQAILLRCVGSETCRSQVPYGETLSFGTHGEAAVMGLSEWVTPWCAPPLQALDLAEDAPASVAIHSSSGQRALRLPLAQPETGTLVTRRLALALERPPASIAAAQLVLTADLDGDGMPDSVFELGGDAAATVVGISEGEAMTVWDFTDPSDRVTRVLGAVDLEGDGRWSLVTWSQSTDGFVFRHLQVQANLWVVTEQWGCGR